MPDSRGLDRVRHSRLTPQHLGSYDAARPHWLSPGGRANMLKMAADAVPPQRQGGIVGQVLTHALLSHSTPDRDHPAARYPRPTRLAGAPAVCHYFAVVFPMRTAAQLGDTATRLRVASRRKRRTYGGSEYRADGPG